MGSERKGGSPDLWSAPDWDKAPKEREEPVHGGEW